MRFATIITALASLALPFGAQANNGHAARHNHHELARRAKGDVSLFERSSFTNARFTYYAVGLGACGDTNVPSDFIVALNVEQYGNGYPGPFCFEMITISYGGKTATAQIMDECMGCPYGGLDFSQGLFEYFADLGEGVLYGEWWFNNGNGGGGSAPTSTSSKWTPTSTWTPPTSTWSPPPSSKWTPSTTWTPPSSTWTPPSSIWSSSSSSWTPSSSSTSSSSSWSKSSSSSSSSPSSSSSSSSTSSTATSSTATASASPTSVLESLNQAFLGAGALIAGGAQA